MTPKLTVEQYHEALALSDEAALNTQAALALAAELVVLRNVHRRLAREHRLPIALIRALNSLPAPADVAAWKRAVAQARIAAEAIEPGAPALLTLTR